MCVMSVSIWTCVRTAVYEPVLASLPSSCRFLCFDFDSFLFSLPLSLFFFLSISLHTPLSVSLSLSLSSFSPCLVALDVSLLLPAHCGVTSLVNYYYYHLFPISYFLCKSRTHSRRTPLGGGGWGEKAWRSASYHLGGRPSI
ncbi:hypothetical protein GGS23DRAFT_409365 [Durotheca rogersii]|uniref:uncharacterized protein n=1 Tax=Durotheca rogersii TaxID=419775 RepID=UPI00221EB029|nr:uncharacterized protein GGS23DRAFT_409365 [Durotheca rogersii]KAI5865106.1 hypothetical protein GGS23DRAFT_409365 [Durotheca rogersii]